MSEIENKIVIDQLQALVRGSEMDWKNSNILFADVKGYSSLNDHEMRAFHADVFRKAGAIFDEYSPSDVNTWGDGIVATCDDISELCELALKLRDHFSRTNWQKIGLPRLDVRISIHHGQYSTDLDPITKKPNFIGSTIVKAARLEPVVSPGMIWLTETAKAILKDYVEQNKIDYFAIDEVGEIPLAKGYGATNVSILRRRIEPATPQEEIDNIRRSAEIRISSENPEPANEQPRAASVVIAIITFGDKVLLVKRRQNDEGLDWMFPSGKLLPNEDRRYVVEKEVRAETGVRCTYRKILSETKRHPLTGVPCQYLICEVEAEEETRNGDPMENEQVEWVPISDAVKRIGDTLNSKVHNHLISLV